MKTQFVSILTLLLICCYVGSATAAGDDEKPEPLVFPASYKVVSVSNGGTISGTIKYDGKAPEMATLDVTKDKHVCAKTDKVDESIVIGAGNGLQNTIVYLVDITQGGDFPKTNEKGEPIDYEIDQDGCQFKPHVKLIPVGERLTMLNSDKIMHNIHIFSDKGYNKAQPKMKRKMPIPAVKDAEGPIPIKCDVHGWMSGWLAYIPHPYFAVSNEKGEYTIKNVPPGEYKLAYWHEACGTNKDMAVSVSISAGGTVKKDFSLKVK